MGGWAGGYIPSQLLPPRVNNHRARTSWIALMDHLGSLPGVSLVPFKGPYACNECRHNPVVHGPCVCSRPLCMYFASLKVFISG